jgi:hypothetical protein
MGYNVSIPPIHSPLSSTMSIPTNSIVDRFCGTNVDDCIVEYLILLWPYYLYFLIMLPLRVYEIRLLPRSYPPRWWPLSHLIKRVLVVSVLVGTLVGLIGLSLAHELRPYLFISILIHLVAWASAYSILASEYKRYQPMTWFGLRGFWTLTGIEGLGRLFWMFASPEEASAEFLIAHPRYSLVIEGMVCVVEILLALMALRVPNDLNIHLLNHIQRLLLEHPSMEIEQGEYGGGDDSARSTSAVYTLHEDDSEMSNYSNFQAKRADTPGWIYSVEEEQPFLPKIDIIDVHVLAINKDKTMRTVYRVHTRVTTGSADEKRTSFDHSSMVIEFNAKRRYKDLRFLDDQFRGIFNHSKFPEQRASIGNFPPREIVQADPFARQIALREYLRRLSQNPIFYTHEFLDMVGIDPDFNAGHVYEQCLHLGRVKIVGAVGRKNGGQTSPKGGDYVARDFPTEPMPWRPPALIHAGLSSESSSIQTPPPGGFVSVPPSPQGKLSVTIPDYSTNNKVVIYRIVTRSAVSGGIYESKHRFSDFQRLSVHLRDVLDVRLAVALPPLIRFNQSHTEFLDLRRAALESYLQTLLTDHPSVVSSRFVRSFFRVPIQYDSDETPVGSSVNSSSLLEIDCSGTESEQVGTQQSDNSASPPSSVPSPRNLLDISVPFWCYALERETGHPGVHFCVRISTGTGSEWTRFHTFANFCALRSDLVSVDKSIDFPTLSSNPLATKSSTELDTRRRILSQWLKQLVRNCGDPTDKECVKQNCPALWNFIRDNSDDYGNR